MQKQIVRFILVIFLMQSTLLGEFAKMPLLVQHFMQHKKLHPETTVYSFIKMHYLDKTVIDADYAQDMQLPFKTIELHAFSLQLYLPPAFLKLKPNFAMHCKQKIPYTSISLPFSSAHSIFQPPKMA